MKTVFTNGCFDIIHPGHIDLLNRARALGDRLVVGINSDASVRKIKGEGRPFIDQNARREILLGLRSVDQVEIFDDPTPEDLIRRIMPDVLVKGGDWQPNEIIGADIVLGTGGEVHSLPLKGEFSSSKIVGVIRDGVRTEDGATPAEMHDLPSLAEHIDVFGQLEAACGDAIRECSEILFDTFKRGNKVLVCGNGGSAADAQHLAAEFVGRYETERIALQFPMITVSNAYSPVRSKLWPPGATVWSRSARAGIRRTSSPR
jgi:rfaE bifunctional protein nucleotidyltransferase chain/domain